jgi:hypothetical protein
MTCESLPADELTMIASNAANVDAGPTAGAASVVAGANVAAGAARWIRAVVMASAGRAAGRP